MRTRAPGLWLCVCLALAACAPEEIIIAYGPDAASDSEAGQPEAGEAGPVDATMREDAREPRDASFQDVWEPPQPECSSDENCKPDEQCVRSGCSPDQRGTCQRLGTCPINYEPVCGCNGVTYYNDCYRRVSGEGRVDSFGACSPIDARPCDPNFACPQPAKCAQLYRSCDFAAFAGGQCWVLPSDCSASGGPRYQSCTSMSGERCTNTCKAIENGGPHFLCRPPGP